MDKVLDPLVRLDTDGIQQIRQELPATRNPLTYYKRVIVSIDTLKNPYKFRGFLSDYRWDVVVIDECHNVTNPSAQNFKLAQVLAKNTDALLLASATPHNGKPESFARLINLLDPTAIADPANYDARDIAHLYVRRHRGSPDVTHEVAHMWAERAEPEIVPVTPTSAEEAVLTELRDTWMRAPHPAARHRPARTPTCSRGPCSRHTCPRRAHSARRSRTGRRGSPTGRTAGPRAEPSAPLTLWPRRPHRRS